MMLVSDRFRIAHVTLHLGIREALDLIDTQRIVRTLNAANAALERIGIEAPKIAVSGINPHAGEGGLFGDEEPRSIEPAIRRAAAAVPFADGRVQLEGPIPAETSFRVAAQGEVAGVVAMMHDQATIASKILDWGTAVNVTWGLPFVRTSVDHGVAYDAAASGEVDARGMASALELASQLAR